MTMRFSWLSAIATLLLIGSAAQAAAWPEMPAACTPDRMVKWNPAVSDALQAPCHCPPQSYCPTDPAIYYHPERGKLPPKVLITCCEQPKCPAGSVLAGRFVPEDGNCNPPNVCPNGTRLAGEPVPANGNCNGCRREGGSHGDGHGGGGGGGNPDPGSCPPPTPPSNCPANTCDLTELIRTPNIFSIISLCSGECVPSGQDAYVRRATNNGDVGITVVCRGRRLVASGAIGGGGGNCR